MVTFRPDCIACIPEDAVHLARGDIELIGNLALVHSLAGEVDDFKLLASQFRHKCIESIGTTKIKSPALGTDSV